MKKILRGDNILTIGCEYNPPKGGVAQVLYTYSQEVYACFRCITNSGSKGTIMKIWQAIWGLIKMAILLFSNNDIRIVHIHTASYKSFQRSLWFLKVAKLFKRKVILHIHGGGFKDYYRTNPIGVLENLRKADCIITLSDSWKCFFSDELHLSNVVTVQNVVPYPTLKKIEKKDNRIHLLYLGAINNQKGIFDLIDVIGQNRTKCQGKLILHVGGNQEVERLNNCISKYGIEDIVKYEGWVKGDKKIALLNLMDAFILPSYVEGLPISLLESLSYGKPVITTPVGGIPEVVNDKNGYMFVPGDKKALSEILNNIIANPSTLKLKAESAKESVRSNFPDSVAKVLEITYKKIIEDKL